MSKPSRKNRRGPPMKCDPRLPLSEKLKADLAAFVGECNGIMLKSGDGGSGPMMFRALLRSRRDLRKRWYDLNRRTEKESGIPFWRRWAKEIKRTWQEWKIPRG